MSPQMLALLPILFAATAPKPGLLVSAKWLAANQHDSRVVVLHIARDQGDYDKGHISGARFTNPRCSMAGSQAGRPSAMPCRPRPQS